MVSSTASREPEREVTTKEEIPAVGWLQFIVRILREVDGQNIPIVAGGVAFFALLSGTPLLLAVVSIFGLVSDPAKAEEQVNHVAKLMPHDARALLAEQLDEIVALSHRELGLGAAISIAGALYVGSKGTFYLFRSLNLAYGERETRGLVRVKVTAILFTVLFILVAVIAIGAVAALPVVLGLFGVGQHAEKLIALGRWPALAVAVVIGLELVYRFGPDRKAPSSHRLTIGSVTATAGWLASSYLFSLYVAQFGTFNETYGSLGTVVALMVWLYLSATLLLVGALLNAHLEQRTHGAPTAGAAPTQLAGLSG
jgi:membrane protein